MNSSKRIVNGLLLLDKPAGMTSNKILQWVKQLFRAQKAGHTGSLDPLATGLLPICFGEATKYAQYLLNADKTYQVTAQLGVQTASGDSDGEILKTRAIENITTEEIQAALMSFLGGSEQTPSMYSALKYQGKPWYEYARAGVEIPRHAREITIYDLQFQSYHDGVLSFIVRCSKGTYVRTLVEDLGEMLGCGAHVTALHRLKVGSFDAAEMHSFEALSVLDEETLDKTVLPLSTMLSAMPMVSCSIDEIGAFKQGRCVQVNVTVSPGFVQVLDPHHQFIGVALLESDGRLLPKRLLRTDVA